METGKVWTLHASSPDLINLLGSFRMTELVGSVLARNLLSNSPLHKIVDEINQLSTTEVVLETKLSSQAGDPKSKSIYVFEVEVCSRQGTLKVNEKVSMRRMTERHIYYFTFKIITDNNVVFFFKQDAAQKDAFFHSTSRSLVRVIWIYSKSVNVVDAKLTVFMNYESYLKEDNIYIHHTLENAENVIIFLASQQVDSLVRGLTLIKEPVSNISFRITLQNAINIILSRDSIRQWCYNCFLRDKNTPVGTIENASYICRSVFTVGRLKAQLVNETLNLATQTTIRMIRHGVVEHIESHILRDVQEGFLNLKFRISDELFASIDSVLVSVIVAIFSPLLGIIVAVRSLVMTLIWSVDVNSKDWRNEIAEEIYGTIDRNKTDILKRIEDKLQNICWEAFEALSEVINKVYDFKRRLKQTDQTKCKN